MTIQQEQVIAGRMDQLLNSHRVYAVHIQGIRGEGTDKNEVLKTARGETTQLSELMRYTLPKINKHVLELRPSFSNKDLMEQAIGIAEFVRGIRN